jgi:hypothetical protein
MNTKLTLSVNQAVVKKAKTFAKRKNVSISALIENYLMSLVQSDPSSNDLIVSPLVKSLSGVISLPSEYDPKQDYRDQLAHKYR